MAEMLTYAAADKANDRLSLEVSDERVVLTIRPPRGLILGTLVFFTAMYAGLWVIAARLIYREVALGVSLGSLEAGIMLASGMLVHVAGIAFWSIGIAIGWMRYWKVGVVPFRIEATSSEIVRIRAGSIRAVTRKQWPAALVRRIEIRKLADVFGRKPALRVSIFGDTRLPLIVVQMPRIPEIEKLTERFAVQMRRVLRLESTAAADRPLKESAADAQAHPH